jgi:hypothetical protein
VKKRCAILEHNRSLPPGNSWKTRLWEAVMLGLARNGIIGEYLNMEACTHGEKPCEADMVFFWNGQKKARKTFRLFLESEGWESVCVEHGWFKRHDYFHFSLGGSFGPFAHFADNIRAAVDADKDSTLQVIRRAEMIVDLHLTQWCVRAKPLAPVVPMAEPVKIPPPVQTHTVDILKMTVLQLRAYINKNSVVPPDVQLLKLRKKELVEMALAITPVPPQHVKVIGRPAQAKIETKDDYVLVVLQVAGDAQHGEYPYQPIKFAEKAITSIRRTPGRRVVIRTHPMASYETIEAKFGGLDRVEIHNGREVALKRDLAGCGYVVTFNSNVVNQAILAGVPCAVVGPHLAAIEGVTMFSRGPLDTGIDRVIGAMEDGWQMDVDRAKQYLLALCSYQHCPAEIANGEILKTLLS